MATVFWVSLHTGFEFFYIRKVFAWVVVVFISLLSFLTTITDYQRPSFDASPLFSLITCCIMLYTRYIVNLNDVAYLISTKTIHPLKMYPLFCSSNQMIHPIRTSTSKNRSTGNRLAILEIFLGIFRYAKIDRVAFTSTG